MAVQEDEPLGKSKSAVISYLGAEMSWQDWTCLGNAISAYFDKNWLLLVGGAKMESFGAPAENAKFVRTKIFGQ